jgi:hypothetical protein
MPSDRQEHGVGVEHAPVGEADTGGPSAGGEHFPRPHAGEDLDAVFAVYREQHRAEFGTEHIGQGASMSETIVTSAPACRATAAASAPTITSRGLRSSSVRRARECRLVASTDEAAWSGPPSA